MASVLQRSAVVLALAVAACGVSPPGEELGESAQALETFPNEQPAFDFFRSKGLTGEQSAGIVGNLDVESGLDPAIVQSGGPGRGIAQWSAGARWDTTPGDNVKAYATQQGKSAVSLQLQLDFIWFELTMFPGYGLTKLKAATTISAAVTAFATNFEGCGACSTSMRIAHAQSVFDRFNATAPGDGGSSSGEPAGDTCTVQTSGDRGACITTAACAMLGDHVSTPGLCPGAKDVQCCTPVAGAPSSPGDGGSSGAAAKPASGGSDDDGGGCSLGRARASDGASTTGLVVVALLVAARRRRTRARPDRHAV